jgi:cytochrome b subunit of formate dehydrogenase
VTLNFHFFRGIEKKESLGPEQQKTNSLIDFKTILSPFNFLIISLIVTGSLLLLMVGYVFVNDVTVWAKEFDLIFFGSRTGEAVSLNIGLKLIHYYLIGILLVFSAPIVFLLNRWNNKSKI